MLWDKYINVIFVSLIPDKRWLELSLNGKREDNSNLWVTIQIAERLEYFVPSISLGSLATPRTLPRLGPACSTTVLIYQLLFDWSVCDVLGVRIGHVI